MSSWFEMCTWFSNQSIKWNVCVCHTLHFEDKESGQCLTTLDLQCNNNKCSRVCIVALRLILHGLSVFTWKSWNDFIATVYSLHDHNFNQIFWCDRSQSRTLCVLLNAPIQPDKSDFRFLYVWPFCEFVVFVSVIAKARFQTKDYLYYMLRKNVFYERPSTI